MLLTKGESAGNIAVIVEILDHNRVLVDGSATGVARQVISFRDLKLTNIKVSLPRGARSKTVMKVMKAESVAEQWAKTGAAKKLAAKKIRSNLNDFDRFKVMVLRQKVTSYLLHIVLLIILCLEARPAICLILLSYQLLEIIKAMYHCRLKLLTASAVWTWQPRLFKDPSSSSASSTNKISRVEAS